MAGHKRLVPFRSAKYLFTGVISILRNGTEQKKGRKKDRFLEKSEMLLTTFDYSHLTIGYVCVQSFSVKARSAKDQCTCMPNSKKIHVCQIRRKSVNKYSRYCAETKSLQTDRRTHRRPSGQTWYKRLVPFRSAKY